MKTPAFHSFNKPWLHLAMRRLMSGVCLAFAGLVLTGCTAGEPIREWREHLTKYANRHGNGDLNIIRESAELRSTRDLRPAQIRFDHANVSASGMGFLDDRFDVHGVLVGQDELAGRPAFFFLVGVNRRPYSGADLQVEDIRLVSCTVHQRQHEWHVSIENPESLRQYLGRPREGGANPESSRSTFPQLDDDFRLEVRPGVASITESRSGARWELAIR